MQNDLQAIKDEIRQLELSRGSGSDVSTAVGSGAFARPPQGTAVRLNELFLPRRLEFKGWVTDHKQCRYQGLTDTVVSILTSDLHKMVLDALQNFIEGAIQERTRNVAKPKLWYVCGSRTRPIC